MRAIFRLGFLGSALISGYAAAATYIAPIPPDSVVLRTPTRDAHFDIFLSKRPPEEIRAFYAAHGGPLTSQTNSAYEADTPALLSYQQVLDILISRHRDLTLADDLRVTIRWRAPANGQESCVGEFFHELFTIAKIQNRQTQFDALCKQYGYLQNAYFQRVPDPKHPGKRADADKVILARAHEQHGGQQARSLASTSASSAQQIAALALSGNGARANELAKQLTQQAMQTSGAVADWDAWVAVLKEGDAAGYRTWVLIPTHPSTW